jgi:hypothetical protein
VSGIEFGLAFQGNKSAEEHAALARLAEGLGFDTLSVYGDLLYQPPLYPLLVMALATRSIRLGPACLNPFTQHPLELAGQAAALDAASGGRAFLGITRGSWLDRLGLAPPRPLAGLGDALEIVRRLLAGDARGYANVVHIYREGRPVATLKRDTAFPLRRGDRIVVRTGGGHYLISWFDAPADSGLRDRTFYDPGDRLRKRFGAKRGTTYLVRPDDHIAAIEAAGGRPVRQIYEAVVGQLPERSSVEAYPEQEPAVAFAQSS